MYALEEEQLTVRHAIERRDHRYQFTGRPPAARMKEIEADLARLRSQLVQLLDE
jgi:hypothetical protein